jgi:hypothetical protein
MGINIPPEAQHAVSLAEDHFREKSIDIGELVHCSRVNVKPDFGVNALSHMPDDARKEITRMLEKVPPEKRWRSHWALTYRKPAPECWEGSYWTSRVVVYDDGTVEFQARW